ncbi:MAG: alpha-amylase family glycosyl hydrolase [Candidatus Aminicenantes bacterium]|nr:alpha-amylase family glycosyl hydrolase [Candidatus Aminicenantes bacterium]
MNRESRHRLPAGLRVSLLKMQGSAAAGRGPAREFHISRACRNLYHFNQAFFTLHGNVILPDFTATRMFAQRLNEKRLALHVPEKVIKAGSLNAMGLIDEILHFVVGLYIEQVQPQVFKKALLEMDKEVGSAALKKTLLRFCEDFPALPVYSELVQAQEYLLSTSHSTEHREIVLEEMLLLWLANVNPAFAPFRELFDDSTLKRDTAYNHVLAIQDEFFQRQPPFGPDKQKLVDMLSSPALAYPDSLSGQLRYMQEKWGLLLGKFSARFLANLDVMREEEKTFLPGPGPATVFSAGDQGPDHGESERFSVDRDWMPNLVLMAKSVYVWLDQLGKKYGRPITSLDGIPDEELDTLARWGFNGLWLIGIWERSPASRRIKQKCGNPEALASAYSLFRYEVAADLGGEAALQNLKARAAARGIRLATDMVPNHMGIDSPWVCEHPEWFVSLEQSPFPSYSFSGEDISSDPRVAIYLEDHYYDRSDAAVVFKWVERRSGTAHYIYHGNDGTRMPWNDTAQLNYLHHKVRETVMQTILAVARKFPIIRFDAAMTLTRRHYQRLWYPLPGSGGDIPSRSGQGMTQEQFDRSMPNEFWREVVDRVAREVPDTLLLAEAFWLMESYFVRSLGMHRVYNSAFMHFLKDEDNGKFRTSLKNVLEFNPEILKRFVNFMNNPDEETALAQFGNGDKYFGACTLLATLPGLPMFGHGQIEGFAEKYGMEYRKAYRDERPNRDLIRRHEQQIFPLLQKRPLFSGMSHFLLYDFFTAGGTVDENVIAFSNRHQGERGLVVYHNCFGQTAGTIRMSAAFVQEMENSGKRSLVQKSVAQGLSLPEGQNQFVVFRDLVSQLKYIRNCRQLHAEGLALELRSYQTHVFVDFREMADDAGNNLARLADYLQGRGTDSLERSGREMNLRPFHQAWRELFHPDFLSRQEEIFNDRAGSMRENALWQELEEKIGRLSSLAGEVGREGKGDPKAAEKILEELLIWRALLGAQPGRPQRRAGTDAMAEQYLQEYFQARPEMERLFELVLLLRVLTGVESDQPADRRALAGEWMLDRVLDDILLGWNFSASAGENARWMIRMAYSFKSAIAAYGNDVLRGGEGIAAATGRLMETLVRDEDVRWLLQLHRYQNAEYFNQEAFANFNSWLTMLIMWDLKRSGKNVSAVGSDSASEIVNVMNFLPVLAAKAGYRLERFLLQLFSLDKE